MERNRLGENRAPSKIPLLRYQAESSKISIERPVIWPHRIVDSGSRRIKIGWKQSLFYFGVISLRFNHNGLEVDSRLRQLNTPFCSH